MDNTHSIEQRPWNIDSARINDLILVSLLLTLSRFYTWFWFFHC